MSPSRVMFLAAAVLAGALFAEASAAENSPINIEWAEVTIELQPGAAAFHTAAQQAEFRFRNRSAIAVEIASLSPDCECTTAEVTPRVLQAGEEGAIAANILTSGRYGRMETHIEVRARPASRAAANEVGEVVGSLTLKVDLPEPVVLRPPALRWKNAEAPDWKHTLVEVVSPEDLVIQNVRIVEPSPGWEMRLEKSKMAGAYELFVRPETTAERKQTRIYLAIELVSSPGGPRAQKRGSSSTGLELSVVDAE